MYACEGLFDVDVPPSPKSHVEEEKPGNVVFVKVIVWFVQAVVSEAVKLALMA